MYMVETVRELKDMDRRILEGQQALERASIKLTENFLELQRTNRRLDELFEKQQAKDKEQDNQIEGISSFMNRAVGVLATMQFIIPIGLFILGVWLK